MKKMERIEEFHKLVGLHDPSFCKDSHTPIIYKENAFCEAVKKLVSMLDGNETLVSRMEKL